MEIVKIEPIEGQTVQLCYAPESLDMGMRRCDRRKNHGGKHTWEIIDIADDEAAARVGVTCISTSAYRGMRDRIKELARQFEAVQAMAAECGFGDEEGQAHPEQAMRVLAECNANKSALLVQIRALTKEAT